VADLAPGERLAGAGVRRGRLETAADAVGLAVVTDTVCYFCWILVLFSAAPAAAAFNRWSGGQPPDIALATGSGPPMLPRAADRSHRQAWHWARHLAWLGAGLLVGQAAAAMARLLPATEFLSTSSWTILVATAAGVAVAQTPLRSIPGAAAVASGVLFVVVVTMATQATLSGLASAPVFVAAGFTVLAFHAAGMAVAARLLRLDLASCSVASLANIGGVGSAPLMAALHAPALAPVAVLLALLGYLLGLPAGLTVAAVLQRLGTSLAPAVAVFAVGFGGAAAAADAAPPPDRRAARQACSTGEIEMPPAVLEQVAGVGVASIGGTAAQHHHDQFPARAFAARGQAAAGREGGAGLHARVALDAEEPVRVPPRDRP